MIPEDVKALASPAVSHRITLRPEMWVRKIQGADIVEELLPDDGAADDRGRGDTE